MGSPLCDRIYLTEILAVFPADTYFPPIDRALYHEIRYICMTLYTLHLNSSCWNSKYCVMQSA